MKYSITILFLIFSVISAFGQKTKSRKNNKSENTTEERLKETPQPFVLGVIDEIQSEVLGENRILNIYFPEGYDPNDTVKYPVIYLLDGSADEDFIHVVGLVQFSTFEWVNVLPKSIVVGIATVDRRRDFTYPTNDEKLKKFVPTNGGSDKFISFIEKELQPHIESKYKASTTERTLIGQSLGGLMATTILFKKPELFNRYVIISPSLWWDNGSLLEMNPAVLNEDFTQQTTIYVGVGKEGLTPTEPPRVMEVDANILANKLKQTKSKAVTVSFDYLPLENHATIMHQALMNAFPLLYPQKEE